MERSDEQVIRQVYKNEFGSSFITSSGYLINDIQNLITY